MNNQVMIRDEYQQEHQQTLGYYMRRGFEITEVLVSQDGVSCAIDLIHPTLRNKTGDQPLRMTVHVTYSTGFTREIER